MKRAIQISFVMFMLVLLNACNSSVDESTAWQKINDGALLVDVRTPGEHQQGHLEGALLIPHTEVAARIAEFGDDKSRPVVLYCKSGGRAGKAQKVLEENGFTHVVNAGGYRDLVASKP